MRNPKGLCVAIVAAAAIAAFGGAGTASAARTCATGSPEEAVCGAGAGKKPYSGRVLMRRVGWLLTTNLANVTCGASEMELEYGASEGSPITGAVNALSASECVTTGLVPTSCTTTVKHLPYATALESSGEGKSVLTVSDEAGVGFKVVCGTVLSCEFLTTSGQLSGVNGSPTQFSASEMPLSHETGAICPSTAKWDPVYEVVFPAGFTVL
jgi:hypothetical protein